MLTRAEVGNIKKYNKEERATRGKPVKQIFKGGSTGEIKKNVCSYCGKQYKPSTYSIESEYFYCCEECSVRRLPLDLRGVKEDKSTGVKSTRKSEIDQNVQLKPTALEVTEYKSGTQGYPQNVEAFERHVKGKKVETRGRPKKYKTQEEKKEAHKNYQRKRAAEARR